MYPKDHDDSDFVSTPMRGVRDFAPVVWDADNVRWGDREVLNVTTVPPTVHTTRQLVRALSPMPLSWTVTAGILTPDATVLQAAFLRVEIGVGSMMIERDYPLRNAAALPVAGPFDDTFDVTQIAAEVFNARVRIVTNDPVTVECWACIAPLSVSVPVRQRGG